MASNEIKPEMVFEERDHEVTLTLVIDGLKCERKLMNMFKSTPKNGTVLNEVFNDQAINIGLEFRPTGKRYRLNIKRLPSPINPEKSGVKYEKDKIIVTLIKKSNESWEPFKDNDFETCHLVKK